MNFITSPMFKLLVYVAIAAFAYVASLKDLSAETIKNYIWWDWMMLCAGLGSVIATTILAFLNQSIARNDGQMLNTPKQPTQLTSSVVSKP